MKEVIGKIYYQRLYRGRGHPIERMESDNGHQLINPNKVGVFEGSFFWERRWWGKFETSPPPSFIFQDRLIKYQHHSMQLLNNLLRVG